MPVHCPVLGLSDSLWHPLADTRNTNEPRKASSRALNVHAMAFGYIIRRSYARTGLIQTDSNLSPCSFGTRVSSRAHFQRISTVATHRDLAKEIT